MNRAVAAKLKNPHLSLFDALDMGGFTYPRNVDAATMDNDRVTLGQRKNQLNRRLRLARSNLKKAADKKGGNKSGDKAEPGSPSAAGKASVASGTSPLVIANSYLRQQKRSRATSKVAPKRAAPVKMEQPRPKKQCLPVVSCNSSACSSAPISTSSKGITLNSAFNQTVLSERNHGNVSPVCDGISSLSSLPVLTTNPTTQEEAWWPATNISFLNAPQEELKTSLVLPDFTTASLDQTLSVLGLPLENSVKTVSTNSAASPTVGPQQHVLQQTTNALLHTDGMNIIGDLRPTVPSPPVPQAPAPVAEDTETLKEELGLKIFQAGLQDLYKKSMVAAGFTAQDASESSGHFHKFAFQAWKNECERLQLVLNGQGQQSA